MNKIIITGHTSPVGQILTEYFSRDYDVIGISRSTGYDLTKKSDRLNVIDLASNATHFINLANVGCSQTYILLGLYRRWANRTGKIISFGSMAAELTLETLYDYSASMEMIASKFLLERCHRELSIKQVFGIQPESILIRFANYGKKEGSRSWEPYSNKDQMIEIIDNIMKSSSYISTIDFRQI